MLDIYSGIKGPSYIGVYIGHKGPCAYRGIYYDIGYMSYMYDKTDIVLYQHILRHSGHTCTKRDKNENSGNSDMSDMTTG